MPDTEFADHWDTRSRKYDSIEWVHNPTLLEQMVRICQPETDTRVLDVGTGTGAVAMALSPHVKEVLGIDISPGMLDLAQNNMCANTTFRYGDVRDIPVRNATYDLVTARNVFHNILSAADRLQAVSECLRVLRLGGRFVLTEGIPRRPELKPEFTNIFALKENRVVFLSEDLRDLLATAGFQEVVAYEIEDPNFDLLNWLDNDPYVSEANKQAIVKLHIDASEEFRRAYNVRSQNGTVLIDTSVAFVVGTR